jgi:hypothetical protein
MHVNGKMKSVATIPGIMGGGLKKNTGRGELQYDIVDIL